MAAEPDDDADLEYLRKQKAKQVVLFAPDVPAEVRGRLTGTPEALVAASAPVPDPHSAAKTAAGLVVFAGFQVAFWLFVHWLAYGLFPDGFAVWVSGGAAVLGVLLLAGLIAGSRAEEKARTAAREYHGRYLLPEDWDKESTALMHRARKAVRTVQDAEVNKRGLLDAAKNEVLLPEQLWDIGRVLQQLSALRTRHAEIGEQLEAGHLGAVLEPQRQALDLSARAMQDKVAKLEQYAEQVREADAVLKAEAVLKDALEDRERYVELLASTEIAVNSDLIEELSKETADLHTVLSRSVAAALETGLTLKPSE